MPKFDRPNLPRGVKLAFENVWGSVSAIATALSTPTIDSTNLAQNVASTRVNLLFPSLSGRHLYDHAGAAWTDDQLRTRHFDVPFVLPPLAEDFDQDGAVPAGFVPLVLDEVSVSFDQAALGALLVENTIINPGTLTYQFGSDVDDFQLKLTLLQKRMAAFGNTAYDCESEVFSGAVLGSELIDPNKRANPKAWIGLNQQVDPYQSFMLSIECINLAPDKNGSFANKRFIALPSCTVSLKFLSPMYDRDAAAQNAPDLTYGSDTVSVTAPTANSLINATGNAGVNTNLQTLSSSLLTRLQGSLRPDGSVVGYENRKSDTVYDIICVPMWQNLGTRGYVAAINADEMPHTGPAPYALQTTDEAWIPITNPFVIHNVFAANSIAVPGDLTGNPVGKYGQTPTSATLNTAIGVGILGGVRADSQNIAQVAYAAFTVAQRPNYVIDRLRVGREQQMSETPSSANGYTHELLQVPVVGAGRDGFVTVGSTISQGDPVFVGRGGMRTLTRTNLNGAPPATDGAEQFLVVRWSFQDANGLTYNTAVPPGAAGHQLECYSGVGGSWVFVVGKRHLVGTLDNRRM